MVQSNHASYESGIAFKNSSSEPSSLIVLQFSDKEALQNAYDELKGSGINFVQFHEPSWNYGFTAFASAPVTAEERKTFRKYKLFKGAK